MPPSVVYGISGVSDGSMSVNVTDEQRLKNRQNFLAKFSISVEQSTLVYLRYDGDDYRRYHTVTPEHRGDGLVRPSPLVADALFTRDSEVALVLPVADCIGVILYDAKRHILGLSHLGRHNLLQDGGAATVQYMVDEFAAAPSDLKVWLSPAAGSSNYPLYDFNGRSMHDVACEQLAVAGVLSTHVLVDGRDTTKDEELFSHSQHLKGKRMSDGRQMVVAMMRV